MTQRATRRPAAFEKPPYWNDSPPPPPHPIENTAEDGDPTRYGDWVKNGIAVDF